MEHIIEFNQFINEGKAKPGPDPYMRGLSDKEKEDKEEKMKKQAEMDDDDPAAYKEMPGDKEAREKGEVKTSKHVKSYHELYGDDESNESVVTEGKMPDKYIGNDEIVFLKTKEDSRGAHYNLYYKGHDIEKGGARFGSEKQLKDFADNYILSNQWYNKLRYADAKPLPESVDMDDLENAKERLSNPHTILDITYDKTRRGDKFVRFDYENKYVPGKMLDSGPHFVNVRYDNTKDLKKISKELSMDLKESVLNEEKAKGDRGPIDDEKVEKALKKKSEETGVPLEFLRIVMRRGMAAWRTGHRPGAGIHQWGYARVNSFLTKAEGTWGDADADVAKEVRDGGYDKDLKKA